MSRFTVGDFEVDVGDAGHPISVSIRQLHRNDRMLFFDHRQLADLEYAINRAKREAIAALPADRRGEVG